MLFAADVPVGPWAHHGALSTLLSGFFEFLTAGRLKGLVTVIVGVALLKSDGGLPRCATARSRWGSKVAKIMVCSRAPLATLYEFCLQ